MSDDFKAVMNALWARLGLGVPDFGSALTISVDGMDIELGETRDGRGIVISGRAGPLASERSQQADQVRGLLKANLGFLISNRAGVSLAMLADGSATVQVQAVYKYQARSIPDLMALIDDVLQLMEFHGAGLAKPSAAMPARTPQSEMPSGSFIVRL